MSERRGPRRRRLGDRPKRRLRSWWPFVFGGAAVACVIAIIWIGVVAARWLSPSGDIVRVPSFVGMDYADARTAASAAHLSLHVVAHKPDFHAPKDRVLGQLPAAGEHVRTGRIVEVVVSDGEPLAQVPNVANMSVRDATVTLENAHLDVGAVSSQHDDTVPEATVLSQRPDALSKVPAGTRVDLVIARGRPIAYAPNFIGLQIAAAPAAAKEAHIDLAPSVQMPLAPSAPPKGVIVGQDPPAGQQLRPGQKITLQVSGGAPPTPVPGPSFENPAALQSAAPSTPPSSGAPATPAPRGLRVSVAIPQNDVPTRVRVVLMDATGSRTLYDQVTRGGMTLSFDIAVTGQGTLQTFIGDTLVNSTQL